MDLINTVGPHEVGRQAMSTKMIPLLTVGTKSKHMNRLKTRRCSVTKAVVREVSHWRLTFKCKALATCRSSLIHLPEVMTFLKLVGTVVVTSIALEGGDEIKHLIVIL